MNNTVCIDLPGEVRTVLDRLHRNGYEAYCVGGCVRDALRGVAPHDWDITTSATPERILSVFQDCKTVETGIRHGTVTVLINGVPLEVTTYRLDGTYSDGRHPDAVTFTPSLSEDLKRRDFTVNAMAYNERDGLTDLFGGVRDLQEQIIRCVGAPRDRFSEDALRILRALRFASVLDFDISSDVAAAVREKKALLHLVSAERLREEFCKLLTGRGAVRVLREYREVIGEVIPEVNDMVGFDQRCKYHCFDVYEHTLHALDACPSDDPVTRLALFFHDVGKPYSYQTDGEILHFAGHAEAGAEIAARRMRALRFDNETTERVARLVLLHDRPLPETIKAAKRLMQKCDDEDIRRLVEIHKCDRLAHATGYDTLTGDEDTVLSLVEEIRVQNACFSLRDLAVNGNDLQSVGIPCGRVLGTLLSRLLDEVIEEKIPNDRRLLLLRAVELYQNDFH